MISISKLLCGSTYFGDLLRYRENVGDAPNGATKNLGPVVVWNATKACNLQRIHCYAEAGMKRDDEELTTAENPGGGFWGRFQQR